jgi:hypothetical protein
MLSCKRAQELLSRGEALSPWKRINLRFHLMMCRLCRRAASQLRFIDRAARKLAAATASREEPNLSPEARERIRKALRGS